MKYSDYVFGKFLEEIDPLVRTIVRHEEARQKDKIILIPSESICPAPVLEALGTSFNNVYAEGYPPSMMDGEDEQSLSEFNFQLARYRRYSDRRFYKGCEFGNLIEAIARRRAAQLFRTEKNPSENIFVNVQPLSGSIANSAIYDAFLSSGDVLMGMSLMHGGHLTHGSEFNRSGKQYRIVSYEVNPATEKLDYDQIESMTFAHRPKMIIAGYTSYPWAPDWERFRSIADRVGALLLADISHPAGLVVAGVYPNPIDYAHITMCTTHKTLFGPRGAIIMTTDREHAEKIDQAIFPGEQGGPHLNKFTAMAVAFKIAQTLEFKEVQKRIIQNAQHLGQALQRNGLKLAYGGTDTHILLIDLNSIETKSGFPLKGEIAVRLLDLAGIVANKNTIPGDSETAEASGVRLGTPWITQRGITDEGIEELGNIIAMVLTNIHPFTYEGLTGSLPRGKIDLELLLEAQTRIRRLVQGLKAEGKSVQQKSPQGKTQHNPDLSALLVSGRRSVLFFEAICTRKVLSLRSNQTLLSYLLDRRGRLIAPVLLHRFEANDHGEDHFVLLCRGEAKERVKSWLSGLSDGYAAFEDEDIFKKIDGPVIIREADEFSDEVSQKGVLEQIMSILQRVNAETSLPSLEGGMDVHDLFKRFPEQFDLSKPYFIGQHLLLAVMGESKKQEFVYEGEPDEPRESSLYEEHRRMGAQMVNFAGWKMPIRYESILEEHRAVRERAGLFDISHMGVLDVTGKHATQFLDVLCTNYAPWINAGESQYSYMLDIDGGVIDDVMLYKVSDERYIIVVNAVNSEKDLAWMNAVNSKGVLIDRQNPYKEILAEVEIRNLKNKSESGGDSLVNLALQGPASLHILREIARNEQDRVALTRLQKTKFLFLTLGDLEVMLSRTGYTGEQFGYEIFLHPDRAPDMWKLLLEAGERFGLKPVGLGARDSLRTEAGLPLYGHELSGPLSISPIEAGFGYYVKFHKAFFIGRTPMLKWMLSSKMAVARFRMISKGVRIVKPGDLVASSRTQQIVGHVTSCAVDAEGFQVGMTYLDRRFTREGTKIALIPAPAGERAQCTPLGELRIGDRFPLQVEATVLSRFPIKES